MTVRKTNKALGMASPALIGDGPLRAVLQTQQAAIVRVAQDILDLDRRLSLTDDMPSFALALEYVCRLDYVLGRIRFWKRRVVFETRGDTQPSISPEILMGEIPLEQALVGTAVRGNGGTGSTTVSYGDIYPIDASGWTE